MDDRLGLPLEGSIKINVASESSSSEQATFWNPAMSANAIRVAGRMPESERTEDRDLLQRFEAGDRDAFTDVYRSHQKAVFRFALLMTGDSVKAAETTQDVFVWLIHHPGNFDPRRGALGDFLVGVARKLLKRRFSEEQRWVPFNESASDAGVQSEPDPQLDDIARLRSAIATLPERYRSVVVLCDLEGKTYEQAAVVVESPVGTVRSRLHRARALLARKLVGRGYAA
jgi:RNA polymerase sigma factor (sigma-70 family)